MNLGFSEGVFFDGRPFLAELWATEGITMVTVFFSSIGFKADAIEKETSACDPEATAEVREYLKTLGALKYRSKKHDKNFQLALLYDNSGHKMLSCNIAIGVDYESKPYADMGFSFWNLHAFEQRKVDYWTMPIRDAIKDEKAGRVIRDSLKGFDIELENLYGSFDGYMDNMGGGLPYETLMKIKEGLEIL